MNKLLLAAMAVSVAGFAFSNMVASAEAGYWGKKKTSLIESNKAGHRIFVPAHWDKKSRSYIYPEYITVNPHTSGHRHYAVRYRAVRVHEGMTFTRTRTVGQASACLQPFDTMGSKYRGKHRVFRVCP
ncbi:hypothetical protein FDK21_03595 [Cohaesibacter sp. CAU 1516]|uniref:hypothetical protein n=1 Tax=Cohaesibacter sp. CAU 1516 TaxID=2576038 RepID=UPI0010FDF175|nr:hypothetical protein [Cohaesibacter sp. CAU 1516]TLP48754.1 hypothetical protein FDK21_03595 [Cohaesibacter sp. CAU 1516]